MEHLRQRQVHHYRQGNFIIYLIDMKSIFKKSANYFKLLLTGISKEFVGFFLYFFTILSIINVQESIATLLFYTIHISDFMIL